jgi:hypothetical protein
LANDFGYDGIFDYLFNLPLLNDILVSAHMLLKVPIAGETLLADGASKWLLAGVLPLVNS